MERIEITLYPNQADEVEKILEEFQVPYTKTAAESYKIQCLHYIIFSPSELAATLLDTLAHKFDTHQRINIITHYKPEATISEYLHKFEAFLKEDDSAEKNKEDKIKYKGGGADSSPAGDESNTPKSKDAIVMPSPTEGKSGAHFSSLSLPASSGLKTSPDIDITAGFQSVKDKIKIKRTGPIEGLISKTDAFLSRKMDSYWMILVATVIAFVGLVSNNVAVIIGAMLISPLMSPIASVALNSVLGREKQVKQSMIFGSQMILSAIGLAAALAAILQLFTPVLPTPEILSRTVVSPILILVAIMLGLAGGLAMLTSIPEIIVGVAIAVALVPPAATIGIGIGTGSAEIAGSASLVLLSNVIGMVIGFMLIFLLKGITPRKYYEKQKARQVLRINILLLSTLATVLGAIEAFAG